MAFFFLRDYPKTRAEGVISLGNCPKKKKSDWPWLQNVKRSRKLLAKLTGRYIKILQLQLQLLGCPGTKTELLCLTSMRRGGLLKFEGNFL